MINQAEFEKTLQPGSKVLIRWKAKGLDYSAPGTVVLIRKTSVEVSIDEAVKEFPAGYKVSVPLLHRSTRWTPRDCVRPLA